VAYFHDHEPCDYHSGAHSAADWFCPLEAIGWLEYPNPFPTGPAPVGLTDHIRRLAADFGTAFPAINFRGLHDCSLCRANGEEPRLEDSHVNLFIPTDRAVLLAPARIDHYVEAHAYLPPADFLEFVTRCPKPGSNEYRRVLSEVNGGNESPLFLSWPWVSPNKSLERTREK
jgi:hypothetical protein